MKKRLLCFTLALGISALLHAQDSAFLKKSVTSTLYPASPLITIKGAEIRRFPSNNFLDAVNGLLPWVFSLTPDNNDFLFVVNGFLLIDVNSLSLNDIEEVTFTRNNLNGGLYPFSRAGTFFITLKKTSESKPLFSFNTQYNAAFNNGGETAYVQQPGSTANESVTNKSGHLFSTQGSVLAAGKKWNLYASFQLDQSAVPNSTKNLNVSYTYTDRKDSSIFSGTQSQLNVRSFAQFTYQLSASISMGIYGSYFHGKTNKDTSNLYHSQNEVFNNVTNGTANLPYYNGGAFVDWMILKDLHNRISFEYLHEKLDDNSYTATLLIVPPNPLKRSNNNTSYVANNKRLLIRDELSYAFINVSKFQAGVSTVFSYLKEQPEYKTFSITIDDSGLTSANGRSTTYNQKLTSLNGKFYCSYRQILSGYVGYAMLINKGVSSYTSRSKNNPYAGVELNIKDMLKTGSKINRLDLSINYGDLIRNNANSYWLPEVPNSILFIPEPILSHNTNHNFTGYANPALRNIILKNRLVAVQLNAAFMNNRLLAGAEWSHLELQNLYLLLLPPSPGTINGLYVKGKETQTGVSVYVAAKLIDKPFEKWTLRFNALVPHIQHEVEAVNYPDIKGTGNQFQAGIQNQFSIHNWFFQLNGLAAFNKTTVNSFMLHYLLAGYEFNGSKNSKQNIAVFVQARNIAASGSLKNYYQYYSYAGGGVNISF